MTTENLKRLQIWASITASLATVFGFYFLVREFRRKKEFRDDIKDDIIEANDAATTE